MRLLSSSISVMVALAATALTSCSTASAPSANTPPSATAPSTEKTHAINGYAAGMELEKFKQTSKADGNDQYLNIQDSPDGKMTACNFRGKDKSNKMTIGSVSADPDFLFVRTPDGKLRLALMVAAFNSSDYDKLENELKRQLGSQCEVRGDGKESKGTRWDNGITDVTIISPFRGPDKAMLKLSHKEYNKISDALNN